MKEQIMKQLLVSLLVTGMVLTGMTPVSVYADETEETVSEDTAETETAVQVQTITGFVPLDEPLAIYGYTELKPDLETVLAQLPDMLEVYLDGESEPEEVPVTWESVGFDYETTNCHYYQFSPVFDEAAYTVSDEMDVITDAPYASVFLDEGNGAVLLSTEDENEKTIYNFIISKMNMNQAAACGILANIYCESGFDPDCSSDNGTSYGICQWHSSRKTDLINYCNDNGYDYTTVEGQLYFLKYELTNSYPDVYSYMKKVSNTEDGAYDAGYYWCYNFEIPANRESSSKSRGNLAVNTYWPKYYNEAAELGTPVLKSVTNKADGVKIKWEVTADADGYYVYRKVSGGSWKKIGSTGSGKTVTFLDTSAESGKTYYYTVAAYISEGSSEYDIYETTEGLNYRSGPGTSYSKLGTWSEGTRLNVVPDYAEEADGYTWKKVYYDDDYVYAVESGMTLITEASDGSASYVSDKASSKKIYYLATPGEAVLKNRADGVGVSWQTVTGADSYAIYRRDLDSDLTCIKTVSGSSKSSWVDTTAESGTTYYYCVRACYDSYKSAYEEGESFYCISAPVINTPRARNGAIRLSWEKVNGADGYYIYKKTDDSSWVKLADTSKTAYMDYDVEENEAYRYYVRAYYSDDIKSSYHKTDIIYYIPVPDLVSAVNSGGGVKITWSGNGDCDGYYVYRKTEGGSYKKIAEVKGIDSSTYTDNSVTPDKTYIYTVRAYKGDYTSYYDADGLSCKVKVTYIDYVAKSGINYRKGPGTSYSVAGSISKGSTVKVVKGYSKKSDGYTWYKIQVNGKFYYAVSKYLKKA